MTKLQCMITLALSSLLPRFEQLAAQDRQRYEKEKQVTWKYIKGSPAKP